VAVIIQRASNPPEEERRRGVREIQEKEQRHHQSKTEAIRGHLDLEVRRRLRATAD